MLAGLAALRRRPTVRSRPSTWRLACPLTISSRTPAIRQNARRGSSRWFGPSLERAHSTDPSGFNHDGMDSSRFRCGMMPHQLMPISPTRRRPRWMLRQWPWTSQRPCSKSRSRIGIGTSWRGIDSTVASSPRFLATRVGDTRGDGSVWHRALLGAMRASATVTRSRCCHRPTCGRTCVAIRPTAPTRRRCSKRSRSGQIPVGAGQKRRPADTGRTPSHS